MAYTKKAVKKQLKLLKQRLKTIEEHTGFTITIDKDYFLNLKADAAVRKLKQIKWTNIDKVNIDFKGLNVSSLNTVKGVERNAFLTKEEGKEFITGMKLAEKVTGEKTKIFIYGESAKENARKYLHKRTDASEWQTYMVNRNTTALNNYRAKLDTMYGAVGDEKLKLVSALVKKKIDEGVLTADILTRSKLDMISGINMYDSDQGDVEAAGTAQQILDVLRDEIPITDSEIEELGKIYEINPSEVDELMHYKR